MTYVQVAPASARRAVFLPLAAAGVGLFVTVFAFFPGYMSADSIAQLTQGRSGRYIDWHPPLMAWVWGRIDRLVAGPLGMLLLHNVLFWGSLASLAFIRFPTRGWAAAAAILVIGFFPPVFALLGTIWKDVALGVAMIAAFALLLVADRRRSPYSTGVALLLLLYAVSVRHNAGPAVLPFVVWAAWIAIRDVYQQVVAKWLAVALATATFFSALIAGRALIEKILTEHPAYNVQGVYLHDLTAISVATGVNQLPMRVQDGTPLTIPELQRIYTPDTIVPLICCDTATRRFVPVGGNVHLAELHAHWRRAIREHPGAYLAHRRNITLQLLGVGRDAVCLPFIIGVDPNTLGVVFRPTGLNDPVMRALQAMKNSLLFRGWVYVLLALVGTGWAIARWRRRPNVPFLVLTSSALLYFLPSVFFATACDFRLLWWGVVALLISPLVLGMPQPLPRRPRRSFDILARLFPSSSPTLTDPAHLPRMCT